MGFDPTSISDEFGIDDPSDELMGYIVAVTGHGLYKENLLRTLVFCTGGTDSGFEIWGDDMIIVLGREDFDTEKLQITIQIALDYDFRLRFMSQEDFVKFVWQNEFSPYHPGDPRIREHPGLAFVSSIGFKWPTIIERQPNKDRSKTSEKGISDSRQPHPLNEVYGYSVAKNKRLSEQERHRRLSAAVKDMGLEEIVMHIANLVNERKLTQPEKYKNAIYLWKKDLVWLRQKYYQGSVRSFVWPSY